MTAAPTFDERFDALADLAYRVAYRLIGDRSEAENVAQEVLARAFVRWEPIAGHDEAWVTRVSTNLAIGYWRRHRRVRPSGPEPGAAVDHLAERIDLARALRRLPKRQRQVLALRYLADLSEVQTAERIGCSVGSVKQHASRALRAMRDHLGEESNAEGLVVLPIVPTEEAEQC